MSAAPDPEVVAPRARRAGALVFFAGATAAAAAIGSQFPADAWYDALRKPSWTPPGAVFGPVWTVLYALIAAAGWLAWKRASGPRMARIVLVAWCVQIVLNGAWSWLFFGLHAQALALADLAALLFAAIACIVIFRRVSGLAALLFVPYAIWVSFAALLQASIFALNR